MTNFVITGLGDEWESWNSFPENQLVSLCQRFASLTVEWISSIVLYFCFHKWNFGAGQNFLRGRSNCGGICLLSGIYRGKVLPGPFVLELDCIKPPIRPFEHRER
jgi:hypothetical protein